MKARFIPAAAGVAPGTSELDALLRPADVYGHPNAVLDDPFITIDEKRAILSSWASDRCAVESNPTIRQLPGAPTPVPFEDIMAALQQLDGGGAHRPSAAALQPSHSLKI